MVHSFVGGRVRRWRAAERNGAGSFDYTCSVQMEKYVKRSHSQRIAAHSLSAGETCDCHAKNNGNSLLTVLVVHSIKTVLISSFFLLAFVLAIGRKVNWFTFIVAALFALQFIWDAPIHLGRTDCTHQTQHTPMRSVAWMVFALPINIYEIERFIVIVCPDVQHQWKFIWNIPACLCLFGVEWRCSMHVVAVGGRHSHIKIFRF